MNRRIAAVFAAVCILAALAAAGSVAYRAYAADADGEREARSNFALLASILASVDDSADLADPALRERLLAHFKGDTDLLLIAVYERGGGIRWRVPAESPYLPSVENGRPIPEPEYPPGSTMLLSAPLASDRAGKLAVDALYVTLNQASVFRSFRDALMALGAFVSLAAIVLAIASSVSQRRSSKAVSETAAAAAAYQHDTLGLDEEDMEPPEEEDFAPAMPFEPESPPALDDFEVPDLDLDEPLGEPWGAPDSVSEGAPSGGGSPLTRPEDMDVEELLPEEDEPERLPGAPVSEKALGAAAASGASAAPGAAAAMGAQPSPAGLYSAASGLGWENYVAERLDAELARSASFEHDLSLLLVSYDGLTSASPAYRTIADTIVELYTFRDLSFERGADGFSVILPNIDTSRAMRMAEELLKKLTFELRESLKPLEFLPVFMGISSRAGRLVDSGRIMEEAESALEKAREDRDSHIVAFHPDPDKYRRFLAAKGC